MPRMRTKPPRPLWKTCLIGTGLGCGAGALLLVGAALILYVRATARPPEFARPSSTPPPRPQTPQAEAPPPIEAQVEQVEEAVRSGRPPPALRFTEAQINEYIAQNAGGAGALQEPRVMIRERDVVLTARTKWWGRRVYLTATGTPYVTGGRLGIRLDEVKIGNQKAPDAGVAYLQGELDRAMAEASRDQDIQITDVTIADGQLIISGAAPPR